MTDKTTPGFDTAALYFTDRLLDALADVERFPLTLIEAPMGYGQDPGRASLAARPHGATGLGFHPGRERGRFLAGFLRRPGRAPFPTTRM